MYTKARPEDDPNLNRWAKACVMQNLPDRVVTSLALELKHADSVEALQTLVNTMLHDHKTGLLRGQTGSMLYLTETEAEKPPEQEQPDKPDNHTPNKIAADAYKRDQSYTAEELQTWHGDFNAATKEKSKKAKGGGPCWHCGDMGHQRPECEQWLKLKGSGDAAALTGNKGKGKGKYGKGKGKGGKGKGKHQ